MKKLQKKYAIGGGVLAVLVVAAILVCTYLPDYLFIQKYKDTPNFWGVYQSLQENREFIAKNPKNDSAYYSMGQTYYSLKDYDTGIKYLKKAIEISPNTYYYWDFLGHVNQAKKDYIEARDAYIKALELEPNKVLLYDQLAWLYYFRIEEEEDKAYEVLKRGLEKFPNNPELLFDITRYYLYDKNKEEFFKYAPIYLKVDPNNPDNLAIKNNYPVWKN